EGEMRDVLDLARRAVRDGRPAAADPRCRQRLAQSFIETEILRGLAYKNVSEIARNGQPGPEGSCLKLVWSELDQRMKELALELEGPYGALERGAPRAIDGGRAALMAGDNEAVARAQRAHPGRIFGEYHASPTDIMRAVRELEHYVRDCGFVALRIEPFLWRKPPTDRAYYPLYAKAAELDVTFQAQVGHTGPLFPSETGRPTYIDEVALDFPELRIVCG